jgi:ABC-type uncharacterized transport system substrate-binding protein
MKWLPTIRRLAASAALLALLAGPSAAHPHVWVSVESTVVYEKGAVAGLKHRWTFDELYTSMAIQGLDANNDGKYDRQELAELAKVNMEGLKEFGYFTHAKLGDAELELSEPADAWLEHKDGILALHFMLPLAKPVLAEAEGFTFVVTDPSYFIAFEMAKDKPVALAGAPAGCVAKTSVPEKDAAEAKRLGEAFFQELGGSNFGVGLAKTVSVSCPKS